MAGKRHKAVQKLIKEGNNRKVTDGVKGGIHTWQIQSHADPQDHDKRLGFFGLLDAICKRCGAKGYITEKRPRKVAMKAAKKCKD